MGKAPHNVFATRNECFLYPTLAQTLGTHHGEHLKIGTSWPTCTGATCLVPSWLMNRLLLTMREAGSQKQITAKQ